MRAAGLINRSCTIASSAVFQHQRLGAAARSCSRIAAEALNLGWKPTRDWRSEIAAYVAWFKAGAP
jgi:hypothetical protein